MTIELAAIMIFSFRLRARILQVEGRAEFWAEKNLGGGQL